MIKKMAMAVVAGAAMLATGAQAAVVSYSSGPLVIETTDISQSLALQMFDSALGTLNSVSLTFESRVVSSLVLTNTSAQTNRFGYKSDSVFFLTGTGGVDASLTIPLWDFPITPVGVGQTVDLGSVDASDAITFMVSNIGAFIGTGSASFLCESVTGQNTIGGGGNVRAEQITDAGCAVSVTYDYTQTSVPPGRVPEPGSLALVGAAGLAAAAAMRRRRK